MASAIPHTTIQEFAAQVYDRCLQAPTGYLFSVQELSEMTPGKSNLEVTNRVLNELLRTRQLQPLTQGGQPVFKAIPKDVIEKYLSFFQTTLRLPSAYWYVSL
jgi:DNA-directed RNA polymerase III subunit RPC6